MSSPSLYEQLGGESAVDAAVDIFYRKVLGDVRLAKFFDDVDMARQAAKQKAFLTMVFGGPNHYTGLDMRNGHKHLVERGLSDGHVSAVVGHLRDTLRELNVPGPLIQQVIDIAEGARDDVLNR